MLQLTKEQKDFFAGENRKNVHEVKDLLPVYILLCVNNFDVVAKNNLDEWMYYLKNNDIPGEFTAPGLKEVRKRLLYDRLSEQEKLDYNHHIEQTLYERSSINTALMKGENRGVAKGLAKGKAARDRLEVKLKAAQAEKEAAQAKLETAQAESVAAWKNVVLNMKRSGFALDIISSMTGLRQAEITSILENDTEK